MKLYERVKKLGTGILNIPYTSHVSSASQAWLETKDNFAVTLYAFE